MCRQMNELLCSPSGDREVETLHDLHTEDQKAPG